jgi:anthranilate phosphoribosyltransferase
MPSPADSPAHPDPSSPPPASLPVDRQIAIFRSGGHPTAADVETLVNAVLAGDVDLDTFGKWLVALAEAGETTAEVAGVAAALRARMVRVPHACRIVADTCGTGGDGSGSFNISTAAAIVVAGAGLPVAKHGNRAVSSRTGSADVLERLGVRIDGDPSLAAACLADLGLAFCLAPTHHPAMARVGPLRRSLGRPTVFNFVGPLCNPAGATVQVIGVGRASVRHAVAEAAMLGGARRVLVVSSPLEIPGAGGSATLDEVSLFGLTEVIDVGPEGTRHHTWTAEDFGLSTRPIADLARLEVDGPDESAAAIRAVLAGESGPRRDVVVLNAAATLWAAGVAASLPAARALAERAIDDGSAAAKLAALAAHSHSPVAPSVDA